MPTGYAIVDARTVLAPDGRAHDVLDAIDALSWRAQLCPLMRHEYTIWRKGPDGIEWPEWAWNVLSSMLLARNATSFGAFFRGYQFANRYWDAPDGLRYWRGRFEIDRGQPDGAGQRRVDEGGERAKDWDGPPFAPDGIGLYEQDERGSWWPTEAAVSSGYRPCSSCEVTSRKKAIVATPSDPRRAAAFMATAENRSQTELGRSLTLGELEQLMQRHEIDSGGPSSAGRVKRIGLEGGQEDLPVSGRRRESAAAKSDVPKARVVRKLLELRAREAPLGSSGYKGVLSQRAIADVADVRVKTVTRAAIELDREMNAAEAEVVE